jgi:hypothetical protein
MSDPKTHQFRPPLYHENVRRADRRPAAEAGDDQQGWAAYRKWLSRVGTKNGAERAPIDHTLYSWRGYHNWADKIRQAWKADET